MNELTRRQSELHAFLCSRWNDPPTIREMAERMRVVSPNSITVHLKALEDKGYIERPDGIRSRGVRLLRGPDLDGTEIEIAGRMYRLVSRGVKP